MTFRGFGMWCCLSACSPAAEGPLAPLEPATPPPTRCASGPASSGMFVDVSAASGLQARNFVPNPAAPIPINDHSRLALVDLDGDGWDDAVMHSLFPNPQRGVPFEHLIFLNHRDGTFEDVSVESGLGSVQAGFFAFGDFDDDGDTDAFAGLDIPLAGHTSRVLLNDGQGHFVPKPNAGVEHLDLCANAVLADFDRDGNLDLFAGNGQTSYLAKNALLRGNGDGTFTDVSASALLSPVPAQPTNGLVACDYDDDGDQDVFVSTYGVSVSSGWDQLWENTGDGRFVNMAEARGFHALATGNYWNPGTGHGKNPEPGSSRVGGNGFGLDCADVDGDGDLDVYLAQVSHADGADHNRLWSDPTALLLNSGGTFSNAFLERGLPYNEGDIDAAMVDFDNDGRLDLAVTRTDKYEGGYTDEAQKGWFGLFRQAPDGKFESRGDIGLKATQNLAFGDVDHDGDPDLLVGGRDQGGGRPNFLFENRVASGPYLAVQLVGDGVRVPLDAYGARVTVRIGDRVIVREKKSSRGTYDSIDGSTLLFGLGPDTGACEGGVNRASLEVRWPDGRLQRLGPDAFSLSSYLRLVY